MAYGPIEKCDVHEPARSDPQPARFMYQRCRLDPAHDRLSRELSRFVTMYVLVLEKCRQQPLWCVLQSVADFQATRIAFHQSLRFQV